VTINGEIAHLGSKADPSLDYVKIDGNLVKMPIEYRYVALYKPRGVISTVRSPDARRTVVDLVPGNEKLFPVGRLDIDSEGLVIMTNDGELTNLLTHPRYEHEKEYQVLLSGFPDEGQMTAWRHGVILSDGYRTKPVKVDITSHSGKNTWVKVIMKEGRKRQIRETCQQLGLPVLRIIRIRISNLRIGKLQPGEWRELTFREIEGLKNTKL
jgi:23S rRNA pseudouridine2605 synthase